MADAGTGEAHERINDGLVMITRYPIKGNDRLAPGDPSILDAPSFRKDPPERAGPMDEDDFRRLFGQLAVFMNDTLATVKVLAGSSRMSGVRRMLVVLHLWEGGEGDGEGGGDHPLNILDHRYHVQSLDAYDGILHYFFDVPGQAVTLRAMTIRRVPSRYRVQIDHQYVSSMGGPGEEAPEDSPAQEKIILETLFARPSTTTTTTSLFPGVPLEAGRLQYPGRSPELREVPVESGWTGFCRLAFLGQWAFVSPVLPLFQRVGGTGAADVHPAWPGMTPERWVLAIRVLGSPLALWIRLLTSARAAAASRSRAGAVERVAARRLASFVF